MRKILTDSGVIVIIIIVIMIIALSLFSSCSMIYDIAWCLRPDGWKRGRMGGGIRGVHIYLVYIPCIYKLVRLL